ncbi:uncharacterized protein ACA1_121790 [Acanthamoeba castellanii str. Neff]|uniref:DUF1565 domain-containing protein n=1 Tax=Acanthamoeba castellanii (strain ATCC 30010 / Neff) TaxID=1257118 RepID=L8GED3_ACACF|nr:uncharacterized protein ACA1_121790 [Acanthamoeba castellanii str. Neff]ELR11460.1 hypothetical protein ACA1_121790 [Acanthamoeba castellanii str. Neff]
MSQAITAAINGDVLEVHPGVYTFANDTIQSDMVSLTIRGAGPPEAIVFSAVQPLQLLVENVLLQNVTFMGGVEVRKNATLDNVVVNSTAHDDRVGIHVIATTLTTQSTVTVFSGTAGDSQLTGNAMQLGLGGHVVANGPLVLHTQGSNHHILFAARNRVP